MGVFLDLNVAYSPSNRESRLRAVVGLLELGYSGAAFNLSLRGVLSDKHRCATSIAPFPLASLLAAAPSLAASASFHRRLLSPSTAHPSFRQFSRVTVSVHTAASAASVGSTSAVLRGYDLVAVRPISQSAFEHVCKFSEVDLISIDFSQKLPFRLKHHSLKLAIKRGIYFEITYSQLLTDNINIKRQILSDAKMLADWTKGKNLIVSSGASNANEVRGPNDVSNLLSFLLGLSNERAKAAISDNCRSLLAKALRKKHFHKETIRIERMPTTQSELHQFSVSDWIKWDPLPSEEGDLPSIEEISKIASSVDPTPSNSNKIKTIDFDLIVQEKPFLLSQHADKLNEIEPVSGDREEIEADEMQLDYQEIPLKECDSLNNAVPGDYNPSAGTLHNNIEASLKKCSSEIHNSVSASDEMQLDDLEALLKEGDLRNDNITLVPGGHNQRDGVLHKKQEAPIDECWFEKGISVPVSYEHQEELCTETDGVRCDIVVPLSNNSTLLVDRTVEELDTPFIQNEFDKNHNTPEAISDRTMAITRISNEATREDNSLLSNSIDEVYAEEKRIDQMKNEQEVEAYQIDQMKDEKEVEGENTNNRDAIVERKDAVQKPSEINLIDDEYEMRENVEDYRNVEEEQEKEFRIIKLDDNRETVDATTSTSSSNSLMEAVLHDLGGNRDWEISNFTRRPFYASRTKGKRKQKGLPLHPPYTVSFKGPFKHMQFKKSKR